MNPGRPFRRDLPAIGVLLGLVILLFRPVLFGGEVAITDSYARYYPWRATAPDSLIERVAWNRDNIEAYFPRRAIASQALAEGELRLWEPWTAGGTPFFADPQVAQFYPFNLPLLPAGAAAGMGLFLAIHFAWAGAGAFLFLKRLGVGRAPALFGAVAFMLNGFFATRTGHPTVIASCAWLPWALLALERFRERPSPRRAILVALPIALSFLAGFPQGFLFIAYLVAIFLVVRTLAAARGARAGGAARAGPATLVLIPLFAFGFAAIQMLPTLELLGQSSRENWDYATLLSSAQHPAMLWRMIAPEHFGSPLDGTLRTAAYTRGNGYFIQNYVSTQNYAGILPLGLGLVGALFWRNRWRTPAVIAALLALSLALGTPLLRLYRFLPGLDVSRVDRVIVIYLFAISVLAAGGLASILGGLESRFPRWRARAPLVVVGLALLVVCADLLPYAARYNVSQPPAALPWEGGRLKSLGAGLDRTALFGEFAWSIYPGNVAGALRIPVIQGMNDLPLRRWQELMQAVEPQIYARRRLGPLVEQESLRSPVLDLIGVRQMMLLAPKQERAHVKVIGRPTGLPRAFVVPRYDVVTDARSRLARLADSQFDPRSVALLEEEPAEWVVGKGSATIESYRPERVVVAVDGEGGGLLLSDNWYPGWEARIDGDPAPILIADHALRLVPLPPGIHTIDFRFRPKSLYAGIAITLLFATLSLPLSRQK